MFGTKSVLSPSVAIEPRPPVERRRAVRHTTVFQVAKLCTDVTQELCILRDISDTGLRAEVYREVETGTWVTFEMRTGHCIAGRVIWRKGTSIGVEFGEMVSVPEVLAHCSFDDRLARMRPPRIDVNIPALLIWERHLFDVDIRNVSQAGMKVAVEGEIDPGAIVSIRLEGVGERTATVRWFSDGEGGLLLDEALTYAEFAAWRVESLRDEGAARA